LALSTTSRREGSGFDILDENRRRIFLSVDVESVRSRTTRCVGPSFLEVPVEYLCLVYFEPTIFDRMTDAEKKTLDADSLAYDKLLMEKGSFLDARALDSASKAVTVKVRNSKISSTDGPFAETKEHLGGFILIRAKGMEEAKEIAAGIPLAKYGRIEVRPIYDIPEA
jgi:hypothetical protein